MGERDDARHQIEQTRARMTAVAEEVSRRMTPRYAKERATEMARERVMRTRDRAVDNPWFAPLLGAGIGALVARAITARAQDARERGWELRGQRWYPVERRGFAYGVEDRGYETYGEAWRDEELPGEDRRARASEAAAGVKERVADAADEMKERVSQKADEYGHRMRDASQHLRDRIPDAGELRERARDQPGLWALGAMALGALFGFAVPISERERRVLEPAREKAREAVDKAMSRAESAMGEGEGERTREQPWPETGATSPGATPGTPMDPRHDPLH